MLWSKVSRFPSTILFNTSLHDSELGMTVTVASGYSFRYLMVN
jgi:hypothetical protein